MKSAALEQPAPVAERNLRLARLLGTLAGLILFAAFARTLIFDALPPRTRVLAALLFIVPFAVALLTRRAGERSVRLAMFAQALPLFFLQSSDLGIVFSGAIVLVIGNLIVHAGKRGALLALLASSPTAALLEMARAPGEFWLAALPITLMCALVGWMLFSASEHQGWLERRLSARLPRPPAGATTGALFASGVAIALAVLALAPFLYLPLLALPQPLIDDGGRTMPAPPPTNPEPELGSGEGAPGETRFEGAFPGELDFAGGVTRLVDEDVLEIRPEPPRDLGPLYMRGVVLDTITTRGASFVGPTLPRAIGDAEDGRRDGWTGLMRDPGPSGPGGLQLHVRLRPIGIGSTLSSVLFSPRPIHAVELPSVLYDPDGFLLRPERTPEAEWLEYRVRCSTQAEPSRFDAAGAPVDRERYLQLPDEPEALRWLQTYAREIVGGGDTPLSQVQAVVSHFKTGFEYSLRSSDFPGLQGVLDFLSSKSGHCSYYAASATLLLRIKGIPTRIATGFLAQEWIADEGRYEVTTRDGHAWIEAHIGGRWIAFEPTPSRARDRALASAEAGTGDSLLAVGASALGNLHEWLTSGDDFYLRMFWMEIQSLFAGLARSPLFLGLLLVTLALVGSRSLRRRSDRNGSDHALRPTPTLENTLYIKLLNCLRQLGHEKRSAQTLREFLRGVRASDPGKFSRLDDIGEDLYRARWGQEPIPDARRAAASSYLDSLQVDSEEPAR